MGWKRYDMPCVWIIRLAQGVQLPTGKITNIFSKTGSYEEAKAYAERLAKEYGVEVQAIT